MVKSNYVNQVRNSKQNCTEVAKGKECEDTFLGIDPKTNAGRNPIDQELKDEIELL